MNTKQRRFGVVLAALALLASACGGGSSDTEDAGSSDSAATGTVDPNGVLNVGYVIPALPLDPHKPTSDNAQFPYASLVYDRLTQIAAGPKLEPMLAESWDFAEDGLSVDFHLRDGVTFSDGTALDANAVKLSLERAAFDPESTVTGRFTMIDSIEVVDDLTVRINTNRKAADLPYALAGTAGSIIAPDALDNSDLDVNPVGSGPYKVTELKLGEKATFERRDDAWDPEDAPAKTINILALSDDNARVSALRSGQVDLILAYNNQASQIEALGDGFELHTFPPSQTWNVFLNNNVSPFDNVQVRQALNYAIDRDGINKSLFDGYCEPITQPLAPGTQGYVETPPVDYSYDPDKARELLAEAGYSDGFSTKLLVGRDLPSHQAIATAVQAQLKEIGVDLEIVQEDAAQAPAVYAQGTYGAYVQTRVASATPLATLSSNFTPPRYPGPLPQEFSDSLTTAFDPNLGEADVTAALEKVSSVANEDALDIFICAYPTMMASSDHITGVDDMGTAFYSGLLDLRQVSVLTK
ncbi:ABC transporter substrate-binding protein [Nocardioides sp.]|uniref:ABC transporter substrate-binding protein n=1 Tax=Nocardioides sp. TaxID=35761 RepID=UPI0039E35D87